MATDDMLTRFCGGRPNDTLQAILEASGDGVLLTDLDGRIGYINTAAEIMTGRVAGEVIGMDCAGLLGCQDGNACPTQSGRAQPAWVETTCRGTRKDGRPLVLRYRSRTVADPEGRPAGRLALFSESSLQESLQRKMVAHERLASLGELATSMIHEVGNPVSVILGFARLLIQQEGRDPGGEVRDRIYREAERCRKIVEQLLGYARSSSHAPLLVPLGMRDVVEEVLDLLSYRMRRRGVQAEVVWERDTPFVRADPGEMKQVLLNLLLNALDACEQGGRIRISGRPVLRSLTIGGDSLLSPVSRVVQRSWVEVQVEDDGAGLGQGDTERFFAPFFTTKEKGGGLGLPVCRRILGERGGTIRLENRPEGGTRAVIEIPGYDQTPEASAPAGSTPAQP